MKLTAKATKAQILAAYDAAMATNGADRISELEERQVFLQIALAVAVLWALLF